jgi:hypothetical protein
MSLALPFTPSSFAPLARWLTMIVTGLRQAAADRAGRDPAIAPLVTLLWKRLARLTSRFDALLARLDAGHPAPLRRPRVLPARTAARAAPAPGLRLPGSRYWLIRLLPGEAASYGSQLQALLAKPETAALLAAAPEAGRILRPLCRLLGVHPEGALALPSAAGKPASQQSAVKPAPVPPPSAVALICAAIMAQTPPEMTFTPTPNRRNRGPPWPRLP